MKRNDFFEILSIMVPDKWVVISSITFIMAGFICMITAMTAIQPEPMAMTSVKITETAFKIFTVLGFSVFAINVTCNYWKRLFDVLHITEVMGFLRFFVASLIHIG